MPAKQITTSPNISILDINIVVDMCAGKFFIDLSPSVYLGSGAANVKGAKVKITNPYGVDVKPYSATYDIAAPLSSVYAFNIPTQNRNYQYGRFQVFVEVTDQDGTKHELGKPVITCEPDLQNKTRNYRELVAKIAGSCSEGKVYISADTIPPYRGLLSTYADINLTLDLPTASGLPRMASTVLSFSAKLFEGTYRLTGNVCASYFASDHITFKVNHKVAIEKLVRCQVNTCAIYDRLAALSNEMTAGCDEAAKENAIAVTVDAIRLLKLAEMAQECGEDPTPYILELEALLGLPSGEASLPDYPISNTQPSRDVRIEGVNVQKTKVGLTDVYTIDNYIYTVVADPAAGGIVTVSTPAVDADGVTMKQVIGFAVDRAYSAIKTIISQSLQEKKWWASIIKQALNLNTGGIGISPDDYAHMTLEQLIQALIDKINSCCNCNAVITEHTDTKQGTDVVISWNATNTYAVEVYLDDVFQSIIPMPDKDIVLRDVANGHKRIYKLVPKCEKGTTGQVATGEFTYAGCADITAPNLSTNAVNGVQCPYNLNSLLAQLPAGITVEWHTANNTLPTTLVPAPTAVSNGIYYAFAKDNNGCYSPSNQVQVLCQTASCTAPQNLGVEPKQGGFLVQFQSAQFPPQGGYTVKRRLYDDADVPANYTTVGSPAFNATSSRWEILDASAQINTEYVYVAISNCGATQPFITYNFSHYPTCPIIVGLSATISE